MLTSRGVREGKQVQGEDEQVAYSITTTAWGSSPSAVSVAVKDMADDSDVTTMVMPSNMPTIVGDVITLSMLRELTRWHLYRVEVKFTSGGNLFETFFEVRAEE